MAEFEPSKDQRIQHTMSEWEEDVGAMVSPTN